MIQFLGVDYTVLWDSIMLNSGFTCIWQTCQNVDKF